MINRSEFLLRFFDILIAFLLLLFFLPFIVIVAIFIKLSNVKGSVFADNHYRVGKDGNLFFMYKFRTMIPNAHVLMMHEPRFKELREIMKKNNGKVRIKDDIRVTPVGRVIRRVDFDEVPQLFNVIKGDMSLVGPRAYFEEEIDLYSKEFDIFKKHIGDVLKVKPGITGLWQISGRNLLSVKKRVEYDYEYTKKRNLFFNIFILLKTPYVVLTRYGAYE